MTIYLIMLSVCVLCSVAVLSSSMRFWLKSLIITAVILSSLWCLYLSVAYKGLPVEVVKMPPDVIVYGAVVEGVKEGERTLHIMMGETENPLPPKLYTLPYNEELAKVLAQGRAIKKGKPFRVKSEKKGKGDGKGKSKGGKKGEGKKGQGKGKDGSEKGWSNSLESQRFSLTPLPEFKMPEKDPS